MRVIKRISKTIAEIATNESPSQPPPQAQTVNRRGMIDTVKGWIDERDANRRAETLAAAIQLLSWKNEKTQNRDA